MSGVPFHGMAVYEENGNEPHRNGKLVVIKSRPKWMLPCVWAWLLSKLVKIEGGK